MPRPEDVALHDLQTALDDLDRVRHSDATYYIVIILRLLRRLNDVEICPERSLQAVLTDPETGPFSRMAWPEDEVILTNPDWMVRGPIAQGLGRREFLPLRDALVDAARRCA